MSTNKMTNKTASVVFLILALLLSLILGSFTFLQTNNGPASIPRVANNVYIQQVHTSGPQIPGL